MQTSLWLIGAGQMAVDYAKVLTALNRPFDIIGRSQKSSEFFHKKTGIMPIIGGIEEFLKQSPAPASQAIVAVGVEQLGHVTSQLLNYGIKNILVEKPGGLALEEIEKLAALAKRKNANVWVAYNRRFYGSVIKAKELIALDGGVISFNFEFTEWSHVIEKIEKASGVKEKWFLANSTHVIDLAFYLGGAPAQLSTFTSGKCSWHKPTIFAGAGISKNNALFSYSANWESPGRWGVEVLTRKHRFIFRPMEKLQIQNIGSVQTEFVDLVHSLDENFKPGLYLQTQSFLNGVHDNLCSIQEQTSLAQTYYKIANWQ